MGGRQRNDSPRERDVSMSRKSLFAIMFMGLAAFPVEGRADPAAPGPTGKRIIFYHQEEYENMCQPGKLTGSRSLAPLLNVPNPATGKPYATHVILAAFNMGPSAANPNKLAPYIHRNDFPIDDPIHEPVRKELKLLQAKGVRVMMMLGGAGARASGQKCTRTYDNDTWGALGSDWKTYYGFIKGAIESYDFDGIDLNVESPDLGADNLLKLIQQLRADFAGRRRPLIITLSPVAKELWGEGGFSGIDYATLYKKVGGQIDWINGQFYGGYAGLPTREYFQKTIEYAGGVYPPEKIVMGTLMDYVGNDYEGVRNTVQNLGQGSFGGVAMWEYYGTPKGAVQWSSDMYRAMNPGPAAPQK
jgi:hypothetical protein